MGLAQTIMDEILEKCRAIQFGSAVPADFAHLRFHPDFRMKLHAEPLPGWSRMAGQHRLNLAGLNAEAPELDCWSARPRNSSTPLSTPPGQVPGAIPSACPARRRDLPRNAPRLSRPLQVTPRQARPGNVKLARHTHRHWLQASI